MKRDMSYLYAYEEDQFVASKICEICRPQNHANNQAVMRISFDAKNMLEMMIDADHSSEIMYRNLINSDELFEADYIVLRKLDLLARTYNLWAFDNDSTPLSYRKIPRRNHS